MGLIKSVAGWDDLVQAPAVNTTRGALCLTCGKITDAEGVVEGYPGGAIDGPKEHAPTTWCKYYVKHHGAEEVRTFNMGSTNWDYADAAQMARRTNWFDPTAEAGLGLGKEVLNAGDYDEKEEGEFKVISDGGAK